MRTIKQVEQLRDDLEKAYDAKSLGEKPSDCWVSLVPEEDKEIELQIDIGDGAHSVRFGQDEAKDLIKILKEWGIK